MSRLVCILAMVAVVLSGCMEADTKGEEVPRSDDEVSSEETVPVSVDASLTGCRELGVARLVSFDHANSLLPEGYRAAEAAEFLGSPTPTGGGVVLAGQLSCTGSTLEDGAQNWADLLIYVHPPTIDGIPADSGKDHLYQLAEITNGKNTLALLNATDFVAIDAQVSLEFTVDSAVPHGSASITDADGLILSFDVAGAAPQPYSLDAYFWHESENGTSYFAHQRSSITMLLGGVTSCVVRAGSLHAEAFGTTNCADSDTTGGVFAEISDFKSSYHFLPGIFAVPFDA